MIISKKHMERTSCDNEATPRQRNAISIESEKNGLKEDAGVRSTRSTWATRCHRARAVRAEGGAQGARETAGRADRQTAAAAAAEAARLPRTLAAGSVFYLGVLPAQGGQHLRFLRFLLLHRLIAVQPRRPDLLLHRQLAQPRRAAAAHRRLPRGSGPATQ